MTVPTLSTLKVDCSYCPIRHRAVCSRCDEDELSDLNAIKFYKPLAAGQVFAIEGERLEIVASVVAGVGSLSKSVGDGRTQMTGLLLPSDFIGRPGREALSHTVTAVTDMTLCCFHRKPFEILMKSTPHVQERLLEMALDEMDAARDWMLLLGRKTAREKIATFLMLIARRSTVEALTECAPLSIRLPITRDMMANYLGLTIETVSRQITALRKDGLITLSGTRSVDIPDPAALAAETGDS